MNVLAWASGTRRSEDQSPQGQDPANAGAWFTRADPKGTQILMSSELTTCPSARLASLPATPSVRSHFGSLLTPNTLLITPFGAVVERMMLVVKICVVGDAIAAEAVPNGEVGSIDLKLSGQALSNPFAVVLLEAYRE